MTDTDIDAATPGGGAADGGGDTIDELAVLIGGMVAARRSPHEIARAVMDESAFVSVEEVERWQTIEAAAREFAEARRAWEATYRRRRRDTARAALVALFADGDQV